ncbi:NAD(P)-dependent alcohol dehydrogenase [Paenibacillus sp. TRM 82003]|uniref:NAD(P)-dependent alcohol dehydrogenase n=1 Tax=Kineococcus sp. TRM81007 TaxID=2925831 RepID=UPI001F561683|nr:NAD(P)-dependent alcohol dehydrogenase [Kineococcus sp. TRM81007]MCI2237791.1 NAD(P)-dependent alcohol dehydrogenase [Kineococcus sp. TRM81007]MCI3921811.1 NAD(P)-dependent alcohol dehydrogenase [Paenibacillus sp. TRM 82003]
MTTDVTTSTITAAVAREHGQPLSIEQVELDAMRPDEVRVRLVATGVCHTDAIVRDGVYPTPLPAVLGHEGAGVVEAVGEMVADIAVGDHVILSAAYCGTCKRCRAGQVAYCEHLFAEDFGGRRHDGTTALSAPGRPEQVISSHFFGQSAFATHANVRPTSVVVVDPDVPLEVLAPLGCGMQTGAGAVLNELRPPAGTSLAVSGAGAVGLAAVMAARIAGCSTVIAIDVHDSRLQLATELGATHTVNGKQVDTHEKLMEITGGAGVDYILDTTAIPALLASAAQSLAVRGTLALVGAARPGTEVPFEIGSSLVKGWTFKTIVQGSAVPQVFIPRLVELWKQGAFPIDKLTRAYRLQEINDAFADSASGAVVKPIVVF